MFTKLVVPFILALVLIDPRVAGADFPGELAHGLQLEGAATLATLDTSVGLGLKSSGLGTTVVFENLLNLPVSNQIGHVAGAWHFGAHHNIDFGYVSLNRENARVVDQDVQYGEYTFLAETLITGKIDSRFIYVAYRHDFLRVEEVHIGASVGASIMSLGAALRAEAGVIDSTGQQLQYQAEVGESVTFPVPLLGLQLDWAVSRRGLIQFYGRFFYLNTSTLRGGMSESSLRYIYYPFRHCGFGVGFDKTSINIPQLKSRDYVVRAGYTLQGLSFYVRLGF